MKELFVIAVIILVVSTVHAQDVTGVQELSPDPSDPTRIDTRAGAGYKYTDFTGGASLNELWVVVWYAHNGDENIKFISDWQGNDSYSAHNMVMLKPSLLNLKTRSKVHWSVMSSILNTSCSKNFAIGAGLARFGTSVEVNDNDWKGKVSDSYRGYTIFGTFYF